MECKHCQSIEFSKTGFVCGKQRYRCKNSKRHFIEGDARTHEKVAAAKAMCVVLYPLAQVSYGMPGKIFGRDCSLIYRWIREAGLTTPESPIVGDIQEIEFDEMEHFIKKRQKTWGYQSV